MDDKTNDTQSGIQGINLLVIPTKKWLVDRNLIKQGFFKGFLMIPREQDEFISLGNPDSVVRFEGETGVLRQNSSLFWNV